MSWRLVHFGGRPGFLPTGSSGASAAHCPSVRSPRPMAVEVGIVSTRSLCRCGFSSSLTQPPETSRLCQQPATYGNAQAKGGPDVHARLLKHALVGQRGDVRGRALASAPQRLADRVAATGSTPGAFLSSPVVKATMRLSFSTGLRRPPRPSGQPRRAGPGDLFRYGGPAGIQVVEAACQRVRLRRLTTVSRSL